MNLINFLRTYRVLLATLCLLIITGLTACGGGGGNSGKSQASLLEDGASCNLDAQCSSNYCLPTNSVCAVPSCSDGVLNQGEVNIDCGGPNCSGCADGDSCSTGDDCASGYCSYGVSCAANPVSCLDLLQSGASSGIHGIDPDQDGILQDVYCDMTTDDGGWTLVASTFQTPLRDEASEHYNDLTTVDPANPHTGIWNGLRPIIDTTGDIRVTCKVDATTSLGATYDVDLSFYDVSWYKTITTGAHVDSCFEENQGSGYTGPWNRRNNLTSEFKSNTENYASGYMEGEDRCDADTDFTVDFNDRGMDSNQADGTDWGNDDGRSKCASTQNMGNGAWHIWSRETTCFDGRRSGMETDIDCGGGSCATCNAGASCSIDADCTTSICNNGTCAAQHCANGVKDVDETDIDCGGSCGACSTGKQCSTDADCGGATCNSSNSCEVPASCLDWLNQTPGLADGEYLIDRDGNGPKKNIQVFCDMTSDGGGYTMLKVASETNLVAAEAEAICAQNNMQLHIPRSLAHLEATLTLARNNAIGPDGDIHYARILGIYPDVDGATCSNTPFNSSSTNCDWSASDNGPFYISTRTNIAEPNGDNSTIGSMTYSWSIDNTSTGYNDLPGPGADSPRFICQVGDKQP